MQSQRPTTDGTTSGAPALEAIPDQALLDEVTRRFPPAPFYPLPMFGFLNRFRPAVTFEVVVFRAGDHGTEVLLRDRAASDVGYAGTCHAPGSYQLLGEGIDQTVRRIVDRELGSGARISGYQFVGILSDLHEERGQQDHVVMLVELADTEFTNPWLRWVPIGELPANIVDHHRVIIDMAHQVHTGQRAPGIAIEYTP